MAGAAAETVAVAMAALIVASVVKLCQKKTSWVSVAENCWPEVVNFSNAHAPVYFLKFTFLLCYFALFDSERLLQFGMFCVLYLRSKKTLVKQILWCYF